MKLLNLQNSHILAIYLYCYMQKRCLETIYECRCNLLIFKELTKIKKRAKFIPKIIFSFFLPLFLRVYFQFPY